MTGIEKCSGDCSENHGLEGMGKSHRQLSISDAERRKDAVLIANATLDTPSSDSEEDGKDLKKKTSVIRFQDDVEKEQDSSATPDLNESDDENC